MRLREDFGLVKNFDKSLSLNFFFLVINFDNFNSIILDLTGLKNFDIP